MDDIPFDPTEGKCSTRKTLEKELEEIEATLFRKLNTTTSSSSSDNEFMNNEGEDWGEPWMSGSGGYFTLQNCVWQAAKTNDTVFEERSKADSEKVVEMEILKEEVKECEIQKENTEEEKLMGSKVKVEEVTEEDLAEVMKKKDIREKEKQRERCVREQRRNTKDVPPR